MDRLNPYSYIHTPKTFPDALKAEALERRHIKVTFARCDLVIRFGPGKDGDNAVVLGWLDAISAHDSAVKTVEDLIDVYEDSRKEYMAYSSELRGWEAAWPLINVFPQEMAEYSKLADRIDAIKQLILVTSDAARKKERTAEVDRYNELRPLCERILEAEREYENIQQLTAEAMRATTEAQHQLAAAKKVEKQLAENISDDHIIADEQHTDLATLFPAVQIGMILTKVGSQSVEDWRFEAIMRRLQQEESPHVLEFRRYDYRMDVLTGVWRTLGELRDMGVRLDDPRQSRTHFVQVAGEGDVEAVRWRLMQAEDVDSTDAAGRNALHTAAANGHVEVCRMLLAAGTLKDARDENGCTPVLLAARRGQVATMKLLLEAGVDVHANDSNSRNLIYNATMSNNIEAVTVTLQYQSNLKRPERLWGWTPLHAAAHQGNLDLVEHLLANGASIYTRSATGKTAEEIAEDAQHTEVAQNLAYYRNTAPAQLIFSKDGAELWIGDYGALAARFLNDVSFGAVLLCCHYDDHQQMQFLEQYAADSDTCATLCSTVSCRDEDATTMSWDLLQPYLKEILQFVHKHFSDGKKVLLTCSTGTSTSPAVAAMYLIVHHQQRAEETERLIESKRRSAQISVSLRRGMEQLQRALQKKVMQRLNERVHKSPAYLLSF